MSKPILSTPWLVRITVEDGALWYDEGTGYYMLCDSELRKLWIIPRARPDFGCMLLTRADARHTCRIGWTTIRIAGKPPLYFDPYAALRNYYADALQFGKTYYVELEIEGVW